MQFLFCFMWSIKNLQNNFRVVKTRLTTWVRLGCSRLQALDRESSVTIYMTKGACLFVWGSKGSIFTEHRDAFKITSTVVQHRTFPAALIRLTCSRDVLLFLCGRWKLVRNWGLPIHHTIWPANRHQLLCLTVSSILMFEASILKRLNVSLESWFLGMYSDLYIF